MNKNSTNTFFNKTLFVLGIVGARHRRVPKRSAGGEAKVVTELKPKKT